jgi:hypothetical protein
LTRPLTPHHNLCSNAGTAKKFLGIPVTCLVHEVKKNWGIRSDSAAGAAEAEQLQLLRNL